MSAHRSARTLRKSTTRGLTPASLSLVPRDHAALAHDDAVDEDGLLDFQESDVLAGIVPVPSSIPSAIRNALKRLILLRFRGDTDALDRFLHEDNAALQGASPFEVLVAGDGLGVLRALGDSGGHARDSRAANARRKVGGHLRLVR